MLKKMKRSILSVFVVLMVVSMGCGGMSNKNITTDSGRVLPKTFLNMYLVLDYSKQFSDIIGKATNDLMKNNLITNEDKDIIGDVWKEHKEYNNILQYELDGWYKLLNRGKNIDNMDYMFDRLKDVVLQTDVLADVIEQTAGDGIVIPDGMIGRIFVLYGDIKEIKNESK